MNDDTLWNYSPYNAAITREQFLFYETRITSRLACEKLGDNIIVERIIRENLFQYPTKKSLIKSSSLSGKALISLVMPLRMRII